MYTPEEIKKLLKNIYNLDNQQLLKIVRGAKRTYPAFQMYPDKILGSGRVAQMNALSFGAYCFLLFYASNEQDCGLNNNPKELEAFAKSGDQWEQIKGLVLSCFFVDGDRIYNRRLLQERAKMILRSMQNSIAGEISAGSRESAGEKPEPKSRDEFTPPTYENVAAHCKLSGLLIDIRHTYNHYKSNGWKKGVYQIVDWHAVFEMAAKWEHNIKYAAQLRKEVELEKMKLEEQSQEQKRKAVIVKNCPDCHEDFSTNRADNFERCSTCRANYRKKLINDTIKNRGKK